MEKRFFKKVGNWLFIIAVLIVSVNSALKGNFEGFIWPLVALGFYYALCMADYMNDDLIAIVEEMIQTLNDLERQLKGNDRIDMEKIMDTLAQMVDGKEWNDESDGLFALSGSIDDGLIQATLKGTPTALVSVIVAHMIENQYVEALIMQAANAFITFEERKEEKKQKEARS